MNYITIDLTLGNSFYNINMEGINEVLLNTGFKKYLITKSFQLYKKNDEFVRVKYDGAIHYGRKLSSFVAINKFLLDMIYSATILVNNLNQYYNNKLHIDNLFVLLPENLNPKEYALDLKNYSYITNQITSNSYSLMLKKNYICC